MKNYKTFYVRRWTPSAIECYKIGCQCSKCNLLDNLELTKAQCRMKIAVFELVRKLGAPNVAKNNIGETDNGF